MSWNRRRVAGGLALGALASGLTPLSGPWSAPFVSLARADGKGMQAGPSPGRLPPTATDYHLVVGPSPVNLTGRQATAMLVNGSLPAPLLRWREGDTVTLRVENRMDEPTSIHWHGLIVPAVMDGVPGLGFAGIGPGETFTYRFTLRQHGTYWYHSHSGFQEQAGFYGAIVIDPREPEASPPDRDYVVVLSDWTDTDPHQVQANLKKMPEYYNFRRRTVGDFLRDVGEDGWRATVADRAAWRGMRMNPTDLADVGGAAYVRLMNGHTPAANWTALFQPGERVRLRFVNAAAMTAFDVRIPGLKLTVVAADGQPVVPVTVDEFRIGNAETYDVIVTPEVSSAYTVFAQAVDRTGYARGTLAPAAGMVAAVPPVDPRPELTLADMGHGGHGHGGHGSSAVPAGSGAPAEGEHAGHGGRGADPDRSGHSDHGGHPGRAGHGAVPAMAAGPGPVLPAGVSHAPAEFGFGTDMRVDRPSTRLDDPGVGLRDNGRRVLTYADLRSAFPDPDGRAPGRTLELHLTGHMERYVWSFNGVKFSESEPIRLRYGERLRIVLVNDTMMEHPIHLHGLWSDLEDEAGNFLVRKHTISVKPAQQLSFRVRADALGRWAMHCHLLYHMESGMFREVIVDEQAS